jgi:hypothetical protein
MKRSLLPLLVIALTFTGTGFGSAAGVFGVGGRSCGTWTEARRSGNTTPVDYEQWVAGFLSGANSIISTAAPELDTLLQPNIDAQGLYAWIDNYCFAHPLNTIAQAADALGAELVHRLPDTKQGK